MLHLYNAVVILFLLLLSPLWLVKVLFDSRFRKGLSERLGLFSNKIIEPVSDERPLWFHAASVGEVMASAKLIEGIKKKWPHRKILVSTFTSTGKETARKILNADSVILLPLDLPFITGKTLKRFNPSILIIMETELWPNLIIKAGSLGIPVALINGRISDKTLGRYKIMRPVLEKAFNSMSILLTQSETNSERFITLGAEPSKVKVTGNIKLDIESREARFDFLERWEGPVFIAGSTHRGEDAAILDTFSTLKDKHKDLKLILAPRHLERIKEVEGLLAKKGLDYDRRSEVKNDVKSDVLLIDTHGELSALYRYGKIVFVGGSLVPVGGHNLAEPAISGKPVIFGPYMANFREMAKILEEEGGAISVNDRDDLIIWADKLLSDSKLCESTGEKARETVLKSKGALKKTVEELSAFMT